MALKYWYARYAVYDSEGNEHRKMCYLLYRKIDYVLMRRLVVNPCLYMHGRGVRSGDAI